MIGTTVSHYRVLEKLGGGGMGVVYRAEDMRLGRQVALKFLPPELTRNESARARFTREARAASALDHANICTIYDIDESSDGQLFIAMAFYGGETLKARLARGSMTVPEGLEVARQIAAGLDRAHDAGIVHRDMKPANVMVTEHGEVRVLDFGVAKLIGQTGLTSPGSTVGTLAYMAPEQVESSDVDHRADLWGLGVMLYQMLTGTIPFDGGAHSRTVAKILALEPPPPSTLNPDVPPEVDDLVLRLLAKKPTGRPESAGHVAEELKRFLDSTGGEGWWRSRKAVLGVAGVIAVASVVAMALPALRRADQDRVRRTLPVIDSLVAQKRWGEAYKLVEEGRRVLPDDSTLARLWPEVSDVLTVRSEPPGARVLRATVSGHDREATLPGGVGTLIDMGPTPLERVRVPRGDHFLVVEAEGYAPVERLVASTLARVEAPVLGTPIEIDVQLELVPTDSVPPGMVRVESGSYTLVSADAPVGATVELGAYYIDRFEVTNAEFLEFVRQGGYGNAALWDAPLGTAGLEASVVARLRDRTGLPGPRGWTGQQLPAGEDRRPVASVSWLEAAAYCAWKGKSLPTLFEWEKAARGGSYTRLEGMVLPWGLVEPGESTSLRANFSGAGTVDVDAHPLGISPFGAYAMAGNVREWTANGAEGGFVAMGGSWRELSYVFSSIATLEATFSAPDLGFRCALRGAPAQAHGAGPLQLARRSPTYRPVGEEEYRSFLTHYRYDPIELDPVVLHTTSTDDWTLHKVRFNGVGGDPILAYLYLPKSASPPYQTLVHVPSTGAFFAERLDQGTEWLLAPHIRAGRAAFAVVMEGMVEREWPVGTRPPASNSVEFRNLMVRHATELSLGLDYLESRDDIDGNALVYVGKSWGAGSRSLLAAIDDRWDAVVFIGGGIDERLHPTVPEALNVNFLPHIRQPKLLVNGRQDEEHPWLTRALPFWELLQEPKELVLLDSEGHTPSLEARVPAIDGFLDRVLGPVR